MGNLFTCPFNIGVVCDEKKCEKCGWNPIVDGIRRAKEKGQPPEKKWVIGNGNFENMSNKVQ